MTAKFSGSDVEMKMKQDYGSFYMLFYIFAVLINFC